MTPQKQRTGEGKAKPEMVVAYICANRHHTKGGWLHVCPDNGATAKEMMRLHKDNDEPHGLVKESDLA